MGSNEAPKTVKAIVVAAIALTIGITSWVAASGIQEAKEAEGTRALLALPEGFHDVAAIDINEDEFFDASEWGRVISHDALNDFLVDANDEGAQAALISRSSGAVTLHAADAGLESGTSVTVGEAAGVEGEWDWDAVLAQGQVPGDGDITVPATAARTLGLQVGDDVHVSYEAWGDPGNELTGLGTRTVSALTYDALDDPTTAVFLSSGDAGLTEMRHAARVSDTGEPLMPLTTDVVWQRATETTDTTFYDTVETTFDSNALLTALWVSAASGLVGVLAIAGGAIATRSTPSPSQDPKPSWWARRTDGDLGAIGGLIGATVGIGGVMGMYMLQTRDLASAYPTGVPVTPLLPLTLLAISAGLSYLAFALVARIRTNTPQPTPPTRPLEPHAGATSDDHVTRASAL